VTDVRLGDRDVVVISYVPPPAGLGSALGLLSPGERKILRLLLSGCSNAQIGRERRTSPGTVAKQVHAMYRRLGVRSRSELAAWIARAN
jgi:DNA-binding NarL/FixJ family response regulator